MYYFTTGGWPMIEKTIKNLEDFWEFFELVRTQKASNKQKITISSIEAGAGLSCGMISRYKKNGSFPSLYNIFAICDYLDIDVRMIFEGNVVSSECEEVGNLLVEETDEEERDTETDTLKEKGDERVLESLPQKLNMEQTCNQEFLRVINELIIKFLNSETGNKDTILKLLTSITQLMN